MSQQLPEQSASWTPPTPTPEAGQGPWCDPNNGRWWVVADRVDQAFKEVASCDSDAFPIYFAWKATVEPVAIEWVPAEEWDEEHEIREAQYHDEETTAKAWRITIEGV